MVSFPLACSSFRFDTCVFIILVRSCVKRILITMITQANARTGLNFLRKRSISTEALKFYGRAAFLRNSDGLYGRISRLFPQNSYISKERSQIYRNDGRILRKNVYSKNNIFIFTERHYMHFPVEALSLLGHRNLFYTRRAFL